MRGIGILYPMNYQAWKELGKDVVATSPFSEKVFEFIPASGRVLDLGCGNGRISKIIKARGYQTYGIDINEGAIRFAQHDLSLEGIEFSVQNSSKTNFQDNFFDAVIEQATLACMECEERVATFREMFRMLKPGGVMSIAEFGIKPGKEDKYDADAKITGEHGTRIIKKEDGSEWFRSHNFDETELENLMTNAGFKIISEIHSNFSTLNGNSHPGHQYIIRKI